MRKQCAQRRGLIERFVCLLALTVIPPCHGLDPHRSITQYVQSSWTTAAGLPQTSVYSIAQTPDGYLWVGTELGLARFDGARFTVLNQRNTPALPSNYAHRLLGARDGSLWVGTDSGLARFKRGVWTAFSTHQGLSDNDVRALCETKDGSIWIGTANGADRMKDGRIQVYHRRDGLPGDDIVDIKADSKGTLWFATGDGLASFDGIRFSTVLSRNRHLLTLLSALAIAPDDSVWAASTRGRLVQIRPGMVTDKSRYSRHNEIGAMTFDHDGNLWMGYQNHGIARLHGDLLTTYSPRDGLPGESVESFFEDSDHELWIGLFDGGLVQLRDGTFATYGKPEGLSANTGWCGIQAQDGSVWMAANTGDLNRILPDGTVRVYSQRDGVPAEVVHSIVQARDGTIWMGHRHGVLTEFRDGHFRTYTYAAARNSAINALLIDHNGDLIVGTYGAGAARFKSGRFIPITTSGQIPVMAEDSDGSLWLGSDGEGLIHLKNDASIRYSTANGLLSDHISALYIDREGVIWIGSTSGGLNRFDGKLMTSYTPDQGLFDSTVGNILEDNFGNLWMGSDNGISRVSKNELLAYALKRIPFVHSVTYDTADGLRSRETMEGGTGTASKGPDGRLWFSTMKGLSVVDPRDLPTAITSLRVRIDGVRFDGEARTLDKSVRLGPKMGRLQIQFTAPAFRIPDRVRFRYRLDGIDRQWSEVLGQHTAEYTNLPPGSYRFTVQAAYREDAWSSESDSLELTVLPPWYRTKLAYLGYLAAAFLLPWNIVQWRTRSLRHHRKQLEDLVSKRTAQLEIEKRDLVKARQALQFQATHDALTSIWNRSAILEAIDHELDRSLRDGSTLTLIVADLDHFKGINDRYGHLCGDSVLREVADRLRSSMRGYDAVGRYGGEEFLILLPGYDALAGPARVQDLVAKIESQPFVFNGEAIHVTCSFGVTVNGPSSLPASVEDLIRRADRALYQAKETGRNRAEFVR